MKKNLRITLLTLVALLLIFLAKGKPAIQAKATQHESTKVETVKVEPVKVENTSVEPVKVEPIKADAGTNKNLIESGCVYYDCHFCGEEELTLTEKCEELIVKALIDNDNLLYDGVISEEVHKLQSEPFEEALDSLEEAQTEEEVIELYKFILEYHFDKVCEEESDGIEIDEEFLEYIMSEIEVYDVKL